MGLHWSLNLLFIVNWISSLTLICISPQSSARMTDSLLQDYAFKALLSNPKTGVIFDATVPTNLTGIKVSALRLRSGSFRSRGTTFKEFQIPSGVDERPYVERLVLVYHNFGNWSSYIHELDGFYHLTPVLGLLAYDASNLSATSLPELDIRTYGNPVSVKFADPKPVPEGFEPKCVWLDLHGLVVFSNVTSRNTCLTFGQGHIAIVVESLAPAESPTPKTKPGRSPHTQKEFNFHEWIVVGSVAGGLTLIMLLCFIILCIMSCQREKKMQCMERASEDGESLKITYIGTSKAPVATHTRTQPNLESEHVS